MRKKIRTKKWKKKNKEQQRFSLLLESDVKRCLRGAMSEDLSSKALADLESDTPTNLI